MSGKWEELTPNGACRRLVRVIPNAAMWVGYSGYCALVTEPDGTKVETCFPSAFLGRNELDCAYDIPGSGCRGVESAMASAEAAVRRRLEENVEAMGGRVVWGQDPEGGSRCGG